jgi:GT2 family glycosyltransferase
MKKIAVLITCHNRKDKTISCLNHLQYACKSKLNKFEIAIYLTDDGSTDGTSDLIKVLFPEVLVLKGNGNLFWAGGMRNTWREAIKRKYDAYLLLNDDTNVSTNLFDEMRKVHEYSLANYGSGGIYIGSTKDPITKDRTYGGAVITNKFYSTYQRLEPNGTIQECDLGNANIMLVSHGVVDKIGILSDQYTHGIADYDYTLTAKKHNVPVLITENYCGECRNDHSDAYERFYELSIVGRVKFLYDPLGFAFSDQLKYMKRNFPYRLPFVLVSGWFKVLFPQIYLRLNNLRWEKKSFFPVF